MGECQALRECAFCVAESALQHVSVPSYESRCSAQCVFSLWCRFLSPPQSVILSVVRAVLFYGVPWKNRTHLSHAESPQRSDRIQRSARLEPEESQVGREKPNNNQRKKIASFHNETETSWKVGHLFGSSAGRPRTVQRIVSVSSS